MTGRHATYALAVLTFVNIMNGIDRSVMWVMLEPIKLDLHLTDTELGWLSGFAFGLLYAVTGIPLGMLADRVMRTRLIAAAVGVWSAMTALCGMAGSFWSLFLARIGVGAAESGAPPASLSVIYDLYEPRKRVVATSIFMSATMIAPIVAFSLGGWVAQQWGWRAGFLLAAAPGFALAVLIWLTVREPQRGQFDTEGSRGRPTFFFALQALWADRVLPLVALALVASATASNGITTFMTSFLMRSHGLGIATAGTLIAYGYLVAALAVPVVGHLVDRLSVRDARWRLWMPALLSALGLPSILLLAFNPSLTGLFIALPLASTVAIAAVGSIYTVIQERVAYEMRATTMSIIYVVQNLVGIGFGAVLLGAVSDALAPLYGAESLRYAMPVVALLFIVSAVAYAFSARGLVPEQKFATVLPH